MNSLFDKERSAANRERAALIKRRVSIEDALSALSLTHEAGNECPGCGGFDLRILGRGDACGCESCGETFDAIGLVRAVKGVSFRGACDFLEAEYLPADTKTRRLL